MKYLSIAGLALAACQANEPPERYGFITRLGRDTISVESVTRRGNTVTSDEVDRFPRVRQRHTEIELAPNGGIRNPERRGIPNGDKRRSAVSRSASCRRSVCAFAPLRLLSVFGISRCLEFSAVWNSAPFGISRRC